jgi:hypothetical protein
VRKSTEEVKNIQTGIDDIGNKQFDVEDMI